jgi:uncharacterized membrane protein YfhO
MEDITSTYYVFNEKSLWDKNELPFRRNTDALPYIFFPESLQILSSEEESLSHLLNRKLNIQKTALILNQDNEKLNLEIPENQIRTAEILEKLSNKIKIEITSQNSPGSGFLVWNESYNKNWKAKINEKEVKVHKANSWAMAIELNKNCSNQCTVEFEYENKLVNIGIFVFLLTFLTYLILLNYRKKLFRQT